MMKKVFQKILLPGIAVCLTCMAGAQAVGNTLKGYFATSSDSTFYTHFIFDGQGNVDIGGYGIGQYVQVNDTVIVFPDKSIFKFILSDKLLHGVSSWVENISWRLEPDSIVAPVAGAVQPAQLMAAYYHFIENNKWGFITDSGYYLETMKGFCENGLSLACKVCAGVFELNKMNVRFRDKAATDTPALRKIDEQVIVYLQKSIALGDYETYFQLGEYYSSLGDTLNAQNSFREGIEKGCRNCVIALMGTMIDEEEPDSNSSEISANETSKEEQYDERTD